MGCARDARETADLVRLGEEVGQESLREAPLRKWSGPPSEIGEGMHYSVLDSGRIIQSLEVLSRRTYERFPESGLYQVSRQLLTFGRAAHEDSVWVTRPIVSIRIATALLVLLLLVLGAWTFRNISLPDESPPLVEFVTLLEAGINDVVFIGAGVFFLFTAETRIKRQRALNSLHRLRTFAHVIDMHQLHKDPERVLQRGELTPSTPRIEMTSFELSRYLDYCSEMLSLTGKIAGLYAQGSDDPVVVEAVAEIEQLTTGISGKIWQKLLILHLLDAQGL